MSVAGLESPDTKACSPDVLAVAKFLRHDQIAKQRDALVGGQRYDMFRGKRAVRALLSPNYAKAQQRNAVLPTLENREEALKKLAELTNAGFIANVTKLETEDALERGLKPQSGVPACLLSKPPRVGDDEYFVWLYNPKSLMTYVYGVGLIAAFAAIGLHQLWPVWARQLWYYVSMGSLFFIGFLLATSIVRVVLFAVTYAVLPRAFWLFPNLFAEVGFFQSFWPLYSWSGDKTLPAKAPVKKRKSKAKTARATAGAAGASILNSVPASNAAGAGNPISVPVGGASSASGGAPSEAVAEAALQAHLAKFPVGAQLALDTPQGRIPLPPGMIPMPGQPGKIMVDPRLSTEQKEKVKQAMEQMNKNRQAMADPKMQQAIRLASERAKQRFLPIVQAKPPANQAEAQQLQQQLMKEEIAKAAAELGISVNLPN